MIRPVAPVCALLAVCAALVLAACGGRSADDRSAPLLVYAASDLQVALGEIVSLYESRTGRRPTVVLSSTGNLAAQIENGAPADLFFAANEAFIERLEGAGLLAEGSRRPYANGVLAVVWGASAPPPTSLEDLRRPEYRSVSIANPEHAPYGMAAREALRRLGVWDELAPRLVSGDNILQAYQFVQTGNADAGIVAVGLLLHDGARPHLRVPDTLHAPLRQVAAVIRGSPREEEARRFLDLASGPDGQAILLRLGFEPPEP